jgi:hypothetical protein
MANREIELHDTRIERIERVDGNIILWLLAYMHESEGRPGWDRGTGWSLPSRLIIENVNFDHPFSSPSLWILDGSITVDDHLFENCMPLPFDMCGKIHLFLSGAEGKLVISGDRAYFEPIGEPVYVEEFPGSEKTC